MTINKNPDTGIYFLLYEKMPIQEMVLLRIVK